MNLFFVALIIILSLIVVIFIVYYVNTLPKRRENKEIWRREVLLYEEKCRVEEAKQCARIAGARARECIDKIAK